MVEAKSFSPTACAQDPAVLQSRGLLSLGERWECSESLNSTAQVHRACLKWIQDQDNSKKKTQTLPTSNRSPAPPHLVSIAKDLFYDAGMQGQLKTEGKTLILRYSLWHPRLHSKYMVTAAIHWGLWCTKGNHSNNKTKTHLNSIHGLNLYLLPFTHTHW